MKFEKQTYTQVPNSLFIAMKDMDECELKVVMLICRYTFGYHREEVKLSTRRIADEIGMNTASVQKGADAAVERGLIEKVIEGNKTTTWRAIVSDSNSDTHKNSDSNSDTRAIQNLTRGDSNSESLSSIKESIKKEKKGDVLDGLIFYGKQGQERKEDKVEQLIQEIERGLRVNITRTNANQTAARRILNDGRPFGQWLTWCISDEWRAAHLYIYADIDKIWQLYPQAFEYAKTSNPQGLEIGL